jgi:hypothetical protein
MSAEIAQELMGIAFGKNMQEVEGYESKIR